MAKGRKRKNGKRTKSGRLSRAGVPRFDHGTERAQAMTAIYGQDGVDAIGRAFQKGLLGEGTIAKARKDTARRLSNAYWRAYEVGAYSGTLGDRTGGSTGEPDHERELKREEWVKDCTEHARRRGRMHEKPFTQLVIDPNPDQGPEWLDRLCAGETRLDDVQAMERALDVLSELAD